MDRFNKEYITGSGITLPNNTVKYIMKTMKFSGNRGDSLRGTTARITTQEGGCLSFLRPFIIAGLPFITWSYSIS